MAPGAPAATSASSPFCRFGVSLATGFAIDDAASITAVLRQARIAPTANRRQKLEAGAVWRCDFVVMAAPLEGWSSSSELRAPSPPRPWTRPVSGGGSSPRLQVRLSAPSSAPSSLGAHVGEHGEDPA